MSRTVIAVAIAIGVSAGSAAAQEQCRFEAQRSATVSAAGASALEVEVGAGSLRVEGRPGLTEVRVQGRACASSEALLADMQVEVGRRGGAVRVAMPAVDHDWRGGEDRYARLDLVIEVPAGIEAEISDGSGSMELRNLGATRVHDGSGDISIEQLSGLLEIEDGSGGIVIAGIDGDVAIDDGSGEIRIDDVQGSVAVHDGSGSVRLGGIGRNAHISDSSGDIDVDGVGGDLIVDDDSSGSIRHAGVRGRVDVPQPRRRR